MSTTAMHRTWGSLIAARRRSCGWTQAQLARIADIHQTTLSQFERGLVTPSDAAKFRIAAAMGCRLSDLFPWPDRVPSLEHRPARKPERVAS